MLPKPEQNDERLNVKLPPTLKQQVKDYARANGVSDANAVRHILSLFFSAHDFSVAKVHCEYKESEPTS